MSDRFAIYASREEMENLFGVTAERKEFHEPNYNITPGESVPIILREDERKNMHSALWGLIPPGSDSEQEGRQHFEVKVEDVKEDEWLSECFQRRRCIVPANGFFKWKTTKKKSTPFYIRLLSNNAMGIAGVYSRWKPANGREVYSFAMLTTEANALVQPVDDRMPVILRADNYDVWLSQEKVEVTTLSGLLKPYLLTEMAVNRVSEEINDTEKNNPELIQPIPK